MDGTLARRIRLALSLVIALASAVVTFLDNLQPALDPS